MSGCVSYSCVRNCHRTFAIQENLCTLGTADAEAAFWYEEGISKLVSRYNKCLIVQGDYVEKEVKVRDKTCIFCFFPIINKYLCMPNVLYFPNNLRTYSTIYQQLHRVPCCKTLTLCLTDCIQIQCLFK
jgi:hypothetical protein